MKWIQKEFALPAKKRGFHLITTEILEEIPEIENFNIGIAHIFICHTSASITINENASREVLIDMENHFQKLAPENAPYYRHNEEGPDDMPAHIKASLLGSSTTIPIKNGKLILGIWQGVYLCEHRINGGSRRLVVTINGE